MTSNYYNPQAKKEILDFDLSYHQYNDTGRDHPNVSEDILLRIVEIAAGGPADDSLALASAGKEPFDSRPAKLTDVLILSHVCRRWRTAIRNAPTLWTDLNSNYPQAVVELALFLSRDVPMFVQLRIRVTQTDQEVNLIQTLLSEMARIRSLSIHADNLESCSRYYTSFNRAAPLLQYFAFYPLLALARGGPPFIFSPLIFLGQTPSLKAIHMVRSVIPWDSPIFRNLSRLSIRSIYNDHQPRLDHILTILSQSLGLKVLYLHMAGPTDLVQPIRDHSELVSLPVLQSLHLGMLRPSCRPLLSRLYLPALKILSICHDASVETTDVDFLLPKHIHPPFAERLEVFITLNRLTMDFRTGTIPETLFEFSCKLRARLISELARSFFKTWDFSCVTHLTFSSIGRVWESSCVSEIATVMRSLQVLIFHCFPSRTNANMAHGEESLRALRVAQGDSEGGRLIMPLLQELVFREMRFAAGDEDTLEGLSDFLAHRTSMGSNLKRLSLIKCGISLDHAQAYLRDLTEELVIED